MACRSNGIAIVTHSVIKKIILHMFRAIVSPMAKFCILTCWILNFYETKSEIGLKFENSGVLPYQCFNLALTTDLRLIRCSVDLSACKIMNKIFMSI